MAMTLDTTHLRCRPPLNFHYQAPFQQPTFSNLSSSSSLPHPGAGSGLFVENRQQPPMKPGIMAEKPPQLDRRASTSSGSSMVSIPVATSSAGSHSPSSMADLLSMNRMQTTSSASPASGHFAPTSAAPYDTVGYAPAPVVAANFSMAPQADSTRSQSSLQDERRGFADALDASHSMVAMSHAALRNNYGNRNDRSSVDSYGFPSTHSTSSTISSTGNFSSYYAEDSASDYSTAGLDIESVNSRTLRRAQGLMSSQIPPSPQSMMGQFSVKVSSIPEKKHKCKVCDKLFRRPSSLRTHFYSHTGDKPFACDVEGCGRHFSVASNLRRHRKVHRGTRSPGRLRGPPFGH
ncbi:hypothetical protein EDB80DRAFT_823529 [Ilyonectria destructans]|nr:hypothetical protein EDB80DRAFT_823529 [Ilyonectria destructans]